MRSVVSQDTHLDFQITPYSDYQKFCRRKFRRRKFRRRKFRRQKFRRRKFRRQKFRRQKIRRQKFRCRILRSIKRRILFKLLSKELSNVIDALKFIAS